MNTIRWHKPTLVAALGIAALMLAMPTAFAQDNRPADPPPPEALQGPPPPDAPPPLRFQERGDEPPAPPEPGEFGPRGPRPRWDDRDQPEPWTTARGGRGPEGRDERGRRGERPGPPPGRGYQEGRLEGDWDRPGPPPHARGFRGEGPEGNLCPPGPRGMEGTRPPGPPDPDEIFALMDTNRDDAISKDEFRKFHETHRPPHPPMRGRGEGRRMGPPPDIERP